MKAKNVFKTVNVIYISIIQGEIISNLGQKDSSKILNYTNEGKVIFFARIPTRYANYVFIKKRFACLFLSINNKSFYR